MNPIMIGWKCLQVSKTPHGPSLHKKEIGTNIDLYVEDDGDTEPDEVRYVFWVSLLSHRGENANQVMIVEPTYAPSLAAARDGAIASTLEWLSVRSNEIIESLHAPNMN
jgi:hypothetical protein